MAGLFAFELEHWTRCDRNELTGHAAIATSSARSNKCQEDNRHELGTLERCAA
jgi:hypothetical protein